LHISHENTIIYIFDKAKNLNSVIFTKEKIELSTKSEQLQWRRSKVVELKARELSHGEIVRELQASGV
jgi:hypothetical protein